jgi:hypothetical protein
MKALRSGGGRWLNHAPRLLRVPGGIAHLRGLAKHHGSERKAAKAEDHQPPARMQRA